VKLFFYKLTLWYTRAPKEGRGRNLTSSLENLELNQNRRKEENKPNNTNYIKSYSRVLSKKGYKRLTTKPVSSSSDCTTGKKSPGGAHVGAICFLKK
jgi:hypothetical protein